MAVRTIYSECVVGLMADENNCLAVQDEVQLFGCQHHALCAATEHDEELFPVKACENTPAHSLHSFMDQPDVIYVAKFVQQLQKLMNSAMGAPVGTTSSLLLFGFFCSALFRP